jgi:hypothetical protein
MAAKKKTVQETRKAYVQAKIATNSASKTPAKLRKEFNTKAATVKGRTEIVQTLGVAGTPQAKMLRATLRSFPTASTGASKPVVTNNVNMPSNNSDSSAVVRRVDAGYTPSYPGVKKVVKRVDAGYTPSYPGVKKVSSGNQTNSYFKKFDKFAGNLTGANQIMKAIQSDSSVVSRLGTAGTGLATGVLSTAGGGPVKSAIGKIPVPGPLQQPVLQLMVGAIKAKKFLQSGGPVVQQLPPGVVGSVKTTTKTLGKTMGKTPGRLKKTR